MTVTESTKREFTPRLDWATPRDLYEVLNRIFKFTIDVCATKENAKCERFYTEEDDGLSKSWEGERFFMNPPYGRETPKWVAKAREETKDPDHETVGVCLIVPRTDTEWFHEYCKDATEIWLLKGRVAFEDPTSGKRNSPQDPSCIVVFSTLRWADEPQLKFWDWKESVAWMKKTTAA